MGTFEGDVPYKEVVELFKTAKALPELKEDTFTVA
jgi:hypothetical protein